MKVHEQFDSIQGEGIHAGEVMSFIRLAGCNLNCTWCDTKYSRRGGKDIKVSDIWPQKKWVCITGGEPLLQQDELAALILKLKNNNHLIEIETNGSIRPPDWAFLRFFDINRGDFVDMVDSWVIDIKLPSSGATYVTSEIKDWIGHSRSRKRDNRDQIKMVVKDHLDLCVVEGWIADLHPFRNIIISPVMPSSREWMQDVAEFCITWNLRLSLQLHRIIWGKKKGV